MGSRDDWKPRPEEISAAWFPIGIMVALGGMIWSLLDFSLLSLFTIIAGLAWMGWAAVGSRLRGDT